MYMLTRRILGSFRFPKFTAKLLGVPDPLPTQELGKPTKFIDAIKQEKPLKLK